VPLVVFGVRLEDHPFPIWGGTQGDLDDGLLDGQGAYDEVLADFDGTQPLKAPWAKKVRIEARREGAFIFSHRQARRSPGFGALLTGCTESPAESLRRCYCGRVIRSSASRLR
jgi:hypothetical protein